MSVLFGVFLEGEGGNIQEMQLHDTKGNRNVSRDLQISFEENAGWLLLVCLKILAINARSQVS